MAENVCLCSVRFDHKARSPPSSALCKPICAFISRIRFLRTIADFLQLLELAMPKNVCFAAFTISFLNFV